MIPEKIPVADVEDDSLFVEEPPVEPSDYSGPIPHGVEEDQP